MVKLPLTLNSKELRPTASSPPAHGASNVVWETHKVDVKAPVLNSLCSSYLFEVAWTKRSDVTFLPALQKGGEAPSPRCTSSSAELQSVRSNRHTHWVSFMKQFNRKFLLKVQFYKDAVIHECFQQFKNMPWTWHLLGRTLHNITLSRVALSHMQHTAGDCPCETCPHS